MNAFIIGRIGWREGCLCTQVWSIRCWLWLRIHTKLWNQRIWWRPCSWPDMFEHCSSLTAVMVWRHPHVRNTAWHLKGALNIDLLNQALSQFIGTHDFASLTATHHSADSTIRSIDQITTHTDGSEITITFEGKGFLYKMIRNIVGTAVEVARGSRSLSTLPHLLTQKDRSLAGKTAPAHGLTLTRVIYPSQQFKDPL